MNNLSIGSIISQAFKIGFGNFVAIAGTILLWLITIWIPYLNVGTSIAVIYMVPALSRGEMISPADIFNKEYRDKMGDFFITSALMYMGILVGYLFLLIPGIVISIAWGLALYLLVDRDMEPMSALEKSNELTHGYKWTIFLGVFILAIFMGIVVTAISYLGDMFLPDNAAMILMVLVYLVILPIHFGAYAHIYGTLAGESGSPQGQSATSIEGF